MDVHALFMLNLAVTLIMTGAIWFAQLSFYPLLGVVGRAPDSIFKSYERSHIRRISAIAWTMLTVELITSFLLIHSRPAALPKGMAIAGFALSAVIWLFTWFVHYPYHTKIAGGFQSRIHRKLVWTNSFRVVAWTARSVILLSVISRIM